MESMFRRAEGRGNKEKVCVFAVENCPGEQGELTRRPCVE
jgi:hypothetical protein